MCVDVYVARVETICSTVGELEAAIGGPCVADEGSELPPRMCLCCVDLEATAERYGMTTYRFDEMTMGMKDRKLSKREMRLTNEGGQR